MPFPTPSVQNTQASQNTETIFARYRLPVQVSLSAIYQQRDAAVHLYLLTTSLEKLPPPHTSLCTPLISDLMQELGKIKPQV